MKFQQNTFVATAFFNLLCLLSGGLLSVSAQDEPSFRPTRNPSFRPSRMPTAKPNFYPTLKPTKPPVGPPTFYPTYKATASIYDILEFSFDTTIHGSYWNQIDEKATLTLRKAAADVMGISYLALKAEQTWSAFEANNDAVDDDGGRRLNDGSVVAANSVDLQFTSYILVIKNSVYLNIVDFPDIVDTNVLYNRLKYKLGNATYTYLSDPVAYNTYSQRVRFQASPAQVNSSMLSSARMVSTIVGSPTITKGSAKHSRSPTPAPTRAGPSPRPATLPPTSPGSSGGSEGGGGTGGGGSGGDNGGESTNSNSSSGDRAGTGKVGVLGVLGIVAALVYIFMCAGCIFMYYREKRRAEKDAETAAAAAAAGKKEGVEVASKGGSGGGGALSRKSSNTSPSDTNSSESNESIDSNVFPESMGMNGKPVPPPKPAKSGIYGNSDGNNGNSLYGGPSNNSSSFYGGMDANGRPVSPTGGNGIYPGSPRMYPPNVDQYGNIAPPPPPPMMEDNIIMPPPPPPLMAPSGSSSFYSSDMDHNRSLHSMPPLFSVSGDGLGQSQHGPFVQVAPPASGMNSIGGGYSSFYNPNVQTY